MTILNVSNSFIHSSLSTQVSPLYVIWQDAGTSRPRPSFIHSWHCLIQLCQLSWRKRSNSLVSPGTRSGFNRQSAGGLMSSKSP